MALLPEARALLAQAERTSAVALRALRGEVGEFRVGFTGSASAAHDYNACHTSNLDIVIIAHDC